MSPAAPSSMLPPLARLADYSAAQITDAMRDLKCLYWPPSPPTLPTKLALPKRSLHPLHRLKRSEDSVPDSGYASAEEDEEEGVMAVQYSKGAEEGDDDEANVDLDVLRSDAFERTFAIKWLTGFIARSDGWISYSAETGEEDMRAEVVDTISALLALFSADPEAEDDLPHLTRLFSFPTSTSSTRHTAITVELNDAPISREDHTSVGLQSWASSVVLAERMCADPAAFGLCTEGMKAIRVLELGAGTGLLSIAVAKILGSPQSECTHTIIATDYHPAVLSNLASNVSTNFPRIDPSSPAVHVHPLDWEHPELFSFPFPPSASCLQIEESEKFDLILAADVIYDPSHALWIKSCVTRFLARSPAAVFWLAVPMREVGRHEGMGGSVDFVFPEAGSGVDAGAGKGGRLVTLEKQEVGRVDGVGRADEGGYRLFKIGWDEVGC